MASFAIYKASGEITKIFKGAASEGALQVNPGDDEVGHLPSVFGQTDDKNYVDVENLIIMEKQPFPFTTSSTQITADGINEAIISGIPAGTTVTWPDSQSDEVTDGVVEFAVDLPGNYTLTFTAIPYLDQEVVIEAVAAT